MVRAKSDSVVNRMWSKTERDFYIQQYYLKKAHDFPIKSSYWEVFPDKKRRSNSDEENQKRKPNLKLIMEWVGRHEELECLKNAEKEPIKEPNKLSGTKWGRKTGENRVIRTASIDLGEDHQAIKWKQGGTKWTGPRPVEKEKVLKPVVEEPQRYYYEEPVQEEVKPDKKQLLREKNEGKVLELVESLNAHGHPARVSAFVTLRAELQKRAMQDVLAAHRATLADHVSRALRRGKDAERRAAAAVAPLLAVQVGDEGIEQFVHEVRPALTNTATDESASLDTRTECCSSLTVMCLLMEDDITEILEVMRIYESIFSGSYLKEDRRANVACVEEAAWHAVALDGWSLLLPLLSHNHVLSLLNNHEPSFARLAELLDAPSLAVRLAAGNALAIAYETVADDNNSDNPFSADVDALLPRLTELVRESSKFRAKRDRRIQRATFRDILKYFEEGEVSCMSVRVGSESAVWSSWSGGAAYAALAGALGGALQVLAPRCVRLRAALALADDLPEETDSSAEETDQKDTSRKNKKLKRHLRNKAASKARDFTRNQQRDKRSAVVAF